MYQKGSKPYIPVAPGVIKPAKSVVVVWEPEEIPVLVPVETLDDKAELPILKPATEGQDFIVNNKGEVLTY